MAGLGWFAVNSVSGAFALATLTGMSTVLALLIVVVIEVLVAFVGHDLVQVFERYASYVLGAIFLVATITIFMHANLAGPVKGGGFSFAGFTLTAAAAFGYAAGWNPYASDYSRYLPANASAKAIGWAAGLGNFISCIVLMAAGAAAATIAGFNPDDPTAVVHRDRCRSSSATSPCWRSPSAPSPPTPSTSTPARCRSWPPASRSRSGCAARSSRSASACSASSSRGARLRDAGTKYENFLLVIAYWIAPWLGIVLTDRLLRRGTEIASIVPDHAEVPQPGRCDLSRRRRRHLDLAVLQPDLLHRSHRAGGAPDRRPHATRRVRAGRRALLGALPGVQGETRRTVLRSPDRRGRCRRSGRRGVTDTGARFTPSEMLYPTDAEKLSIATEEARLGADEGGIPIGAALFTSDGRLLGRGHNRRVQDGDASMHAETNAFRNAGRQRSYRDTVDGDDAVAVLVLLRSRAAVRHRARHRRRRPQLSAAVRTGWPRTVWT